MYNKITNSSCISISVKSELRLCHILICVIFYSVFLFFYSLYFLFKCNKISRHQFDIFRLQSQPVAYIDATGDDIAVVASANSLIIAVSQMRIAFQLFSDTVLHCQLIVNFDFYAIVYLLVLCACLCPFQFF